VSYFTSQAAPPSNIYILLNSLTSLQAITNTRHLESQQAVLLFHKSLNMLFSLQDFRDMTVHLVWAPVHRDRKQDTGARSRALEACSVAPISGLNRVQSAAYLKRMARLKAFREWAGEWEAECILRDCNRKPDHFAYGWSILKPPDGGNNPVWRSLVTLPAKSKGKIPRPSRHTTSTLLRFAVGHGFFSNYSSRFRKDLPPEAHYCPCGNGPRDMMHLMYYCPRYDHIRSSRDFAQIMNHHTPPDQFFTDPDCALLFAQFLAEGRVAFKPEEGPIVEYRDGRPLTTSAPRPSGSSLPGTVRGLPAIPRSGLHRDAPRPFLIQADAQPHPSPGALVGPNFPLSWTGRKHFRLELFLTYWFGHNTLALIMHYPLSSGRLAYIFTNSLLYGCVYTYEWRRYYNIKNHSLCLYRRDGRLCTSYCSAI
jgi:hypothetical protein